MKIIKTSALLSLLFILTIPCFSAVRTSTNYQFPSEVIDEAGNPRNSTNYKSVDASGQGVIGRSISSNYIFCIGFINTIIDLIPSKITNLASIKDFQIKLSWTVPSEGITKYQVKYTSDISKNPSTAEYGLSWATNVIVGQNNSRVITGLQPETTYYFWIHSAFIDENWSVWSDTAIAISGSYFDSGIEMTQYGTSGLAWGDYDNDGYLDLAIAGYIVPGAESEIYHNNCDGTFTKVDPDGIDDFAEAGLAWGDYDNDGYLDLAIAGTSSIGSKLTKIYHNNKGDGTFTGINSGIENFKNATLAWGDYDNDGYLDLAIAGETNGSATKIYHNNKGDGTFTEIGAGIDGFVVAGLAWGDYDNDGYSDLAIAGNNGDYTTNIYHNNKGDGTFTEIGAGIDGLVYSGLAWGDYDNDGDLDLIIAGNYYQAGLKNKIVIYNNELGYFEKVQTITCDATSMVCKLSLGDYDNDGDLDFVVAGSSPTISIYNNINGTFSLYQNIVKLNASSNFCNALWGDYDNDNDLDLILSGFLSTVCGFTKIYKSYISEYLIYNCLPTPPLNGFSTYYNFSNILEITWDYGSDNETIQKGLYYNIRIATEPIADNLSKWIISSSTGAGATPFLGNYPHGFCVASSTQPGLNINSPIEGNTYYWQVATIDTGLKRSTWSIEYSIFIPTIAPSAITDISAVNGSGKYFVNLTWTSPGDDGTTGTIRNGKFKIQYSTFTEVVWSYSSAQVSISTNTEPVKMQVYVLSGFTQEATYYLRIWTADESDNYSSLSNGATAWADCDGGYGMQSFRGEITGPDPTFKQGEIYAFPNPAKNGKTPIIHIECGIADSVEIKIYNMAGEVEHTSQVTNRYLQVIDNKYAYEYPWDEYNGIPSGVYIYCVDARHKGDEPIKVTKKLAIVR